MDMDLDETRSAYDHEIIGGDNSSGRVYREEPMREPGENDFEMEQENVDDQDNGGLSNLKDKEKSKESGKSRHKDRRKSRREEKEHGTKDRIKVKFHDTTKGRDKEGLSGKDSDKNEAKEKDRIASRERKKDELATSKKKDVDLDYHGSEKHRERSKEHEIDHGRDRREKDHHKDKEREDYNKDRDKEKDREWDKERLREKDRDRDKHRDKDRERDKDQEKEHERGKGKAKERERDREPKMERELEREYDRGKEREKEHDRGKEYDKSRERDRGREKEHDRNREREKDVEKERGRDRENDKDREREKDKERERERERDRARDREREKEKVKDRERGREKEKDKEWDKLERDNGKEKTREKEKEKDRDKSWGKDKDKERAKDRDKDQLRGKNRDRDQEEEMNRGKGREKEEMVKSEDGEIKEQDVEFQDDEGDNHERISLKDQKQKTELASSGSHPSPLDLEARIMKLREDRLKKKTDGGSEVLAWVNKSRRLEEKMNTEKEKALHLAKVFADQDNVDQEESEDEKTQHHTGKDLAGVKILHGLDKVIEGGAVVLTLKDQNILADGDINTEADMLENVEIGEQKQRDEAYKAAKKSGKYEDKFENDTVSQKTILPQYDGFKDEGITLDETGRFTGEAEKKLEELRRRIQGASTGSPFEDLTSMTKVSSDYYTHEEMLQFKKPKKKKSLRKKDKLDLDALEAESIAAGLGAGDLGSRKDARGVSTREEQEKLEAEMRSNAYQAAYLKAEEASKALRHEQTLVVQAKDDEAPVFGEDAEDLYKSLEHARKLALRKQDEAAGSGHQDIATLPVADNQLGDVQNPPSGETQENKVVFTEMMEFVWGLQLDEDAQKPEVEDVFKNEDEVPTSVEQEMNDVGGGWTEVKEADKVELPVDEEKEELVLDETIHEIPVGKGLSGALQLLKERGTLKESIDWGGRNMDKKKSKLIGIRDNDGPKEIFLDRLDEFGRIMTPKEAFRKLSHKFHGKGPGKMKQEKRMKQYTEELKLKQMKASDTPLLSMEKMREAQAKLRSPYIVLNGQIKPGQTSDPRSGFATVEKDHPGSLTPMLGDRKVEHFLGIKRKAEPSNMAPPKKPKT